MLNGPAGNETGHDYAPIRSWLAYNGTMPQGCAALSVVPVLSTIPPEVAHVGDGRVDAANTAIREIAEELEILWVDYRALILFYQPTDWHGTLIGPDGTHPSAGGGGADFSQGGLTTTDGYAARTKLTFDVAEILRAEEVFAFDPRGVEPGVESKSWGRLRGRFRR